MNPMDHIARQQFEAAGGSRHRVLGTAAGGEWARTARASELRNLEAAAGRYETVAAYILACAADPLGLAGRVYLDLYPAAAAGFAAPHAAAYWDAVLAGCGHLIGNPAAAGAFVAAARAVWADVGPVG